MKLQLVVLLTCVLTIHNSFAESLISTPPNDTARCKGDTACFSCSAKNDVCSGHLFTITNFNESCSSAGCSGCIEVNETQKITCAVTCSKDGHRTEDKSEAVLRVQDQSAPRDFSVSYDEENRQFLFSWTPILVILNNTQNISLMITVFSDSSPSRVKLERRVIVTAGNYSIPIGDLPLNMCTPVNLTATIEVVCGFTRGSVVCISLPAVPPIFSVKAVLITGSITICTYGPESCSPGCLVLLVDPDTSKIVGISVQERRSRDPSSNATVHLSSMPHGQLTAYAYGMRVDGLQLTYDVNASVQLDTSGVKMEAKDNSVAMANGSKVCSTEQQQNRNVYFVRANMTLQHVEETCDVPNSTVAMFSLNTTSPKLWPFVSDTFSKEARTDFNADILWMILVPVVVLVLVGILLVVTRWMIIYVVDTIIATYTAGTFHRKVQETVATQEVGEPNVEEQQDNEHTVIPIDAVGNLHPTTVVLPSASIPLHMKHERAQSHSSVQRTEQENEQPTALLKDKIVVYSK